MIIPYSEYSLEHFAPVPPPNEHSISSESQGGREWDWALRTGCVVGVVNFKKFLKNK